MPKWLLILFMTWFPYYIHMVATWGTTYHSRPQCVVDLMPGTMKIVLYPQNSCVLLRSDHHLMHNEDHVSLSTFLRIVDWDSMCVDLGVDAGIYVCLDIARFFHRCSASSLRLFIYGQYLIFAFLAEKYLCPKPVTTLAVIKALIKWTF